MRIIEKFVLFLEHILPEPPVFNWYYLVWLAVTGAAYLVLMHKPLARSRRKASALVH